jgi:AraC-like DNA-binding protein
VRAAIDGALRAGERPAIDRAACAVGLSERTLRRQLGREGTSCSTLLDELLRARARTLVTQTRRPLTTIALELGFSASAFTHAYRRWFGQAPSAARA